MDFDTPEEVDDEEVEEDDLGILPPGFFKLPIAKILYPKTHDNPHEILRDMALAPSYAAWYIHQAGEAETEVMRVDAEWEQWYAHACEYCRQVIEGVINKSASVAAIKLAIPLECGNDGWEVVVNDVTYPHESWSSITNRRIAAKSKAAALRGFCKTIEMKINMLPSQLSMAKELYKAPNVGMPKDE